MKENKNDFIEGSLANLRDKASYEAPAGLEAKVMSRIEKKKTPFGLRFASAAVLILAVCVGGILYRPWQPSKLATHSVLLEPRQEDFKLGAQSSLGLKKQDSGPDQDKLVLAKDDPALARDNNHEQKSSLEKKSVQIAAPIISSQSKPVVRKSLDSAKAVQREDSIEQSLGFSMQEELDISESPERMRKTAGLQQEARSAKKAKLSAAPSAAAEAFNQEDPRDKRKVIESWLASLRQQKYAELDRQLREFSVRSETKSFSRDKKEMLFSNKEILFSNKEISNWRIMLKNEKYELLEEEWSQKLQQNK